jgi:predicted N-acetyltransferase YhbS
MGNSFVCRTLREDDERAVRRLVESTFPIFSVGRFWDWKYLRNPNFDRSFVAVVEEGGKIVGCNHWLPRRVKLSGSIVVDSMLGASIAVTPEYRKRGAGRALIHFMRSQHEERKPVLMYMFADPDVRKHFHRPVGGYVPAPGGTVLYRKILNWNKIMMNAAVFNERVTRGEFRDRLARVDLTVAFKVHGAPPLCLHLDIRGVEADVSSESADVTISTDLTTLSKIQGEQSRVRILIWQLLTGRLKVRGGVRKMLSLYRNMWVFREIQSLKNRQLW